MAKCCRRCRCARVRWQALTDRAAGGAGAAAGTLPSLNLKVYIHSNGELVGAPLRIRCAGALVVSDVVDQILREYERAKRAPPLLPHNDAYELRMLEDE